MNLFYQIKIFINLDNFITLLKQTYDDISYEYTAMIKLKNLWQRNQKFTSFFSEFLDLIDELDWNELIKVAVLWQKISDKIHEQLIETTLLKKLKEFVIMCQQINKDLWYNNSACLLRFMNSWLTVLTIRNSASAKSNISVDDSMNLDVIWQYAFVRSDKQKNWFTKNLYFNYDKKNIFIKTAL